jgi:uncharacterized protein
MIQPLGKFFIFCSLVAAMVCSLGASSARADFTVPPLSGPVVDQAGVLSAQAVDSLERALRALHDQGGSQINVLTVPSLEGLEIEQASIKVVDAWKLGGRKVDNGVLFFIAPKERKMRIEVGQGLEGQLTDVDSKRIIEDAVKPLYRSGDYSSGTIVGVYQIARKTDPNVDLTPYLEGSVRRTKQTGSSGLPIRPIFIFLFLILFLLFGRGGRRRFGGGGMFYGGGGGWGGGSGGGGSSWGGGGGGFSGGGASGDW